VTAIEKYHAEFIEQSIFRLNESLPRIIQCLDSLSEDQVWLSRNANTNSIGNLVLHLCGNIHQYINTSLGGMPEIRDRDAEFGDNKSLNRTQLKEKITSVINNAEMVILQCKADEMIETIDVQAFNLSKIGIITHVVEHLSYHTGQIAYITKEMLNMDLGFYENFDL